VPGCQESLLVGALAAQQSVRLESGPGDLVTAGERIDLGERVRDLRRGSDGASTC
jgi:glucose/arabinose dehydrogenase